MGRSTTPKVHAAVVYVCLRRPTPTMREIEGEVPVSAEKYGESNAHTPCHTPCRASRFMLRHAFYTASQRIITWEIRDAATSTPLDKLAGTFSSSFPSLMKLN